MNKTFLEKNIRSASLVFRPLDTFDNNSVITSDIEVYLGGIVQRPIHTREGYIIYMDLPDAVYSVTASGRYFDYFDPMSIDTTVFDPLTGAVELPMRPRVDYPFPDSATLLRGVVKDQSGNPVSGARIDLVNSTDYAITNALGEYVFFFQPDYPATEVSVTISASGYQEETLDTTVVESDTVYLDAVVVELSDPNVALISGFVNDSSGNPVTQARVEIVGTGISTLTDANGNCLLAKSLASSPETISLQITQDGYAQKTFDLDVTAGQTTNFTSTMNLEILPETATIQVTVKEGNSKLPGVLVELIEKNRSGYTNSGQGQVTYYENSIFSGGEKITIRLSKSGYVTRTEIINVLPGSSVSVTYSISPV